MNFQEPGPPGLNTNTGSAEQENNEGNAKTTSVEEVLSSEAKGELDVTHSTGKTRYSFSLSNKQIK